MIALVRTGVPNKKKKNICVNLQPLKRNFDRIETERIYRVIEDVVYKVSETRALYEIIDDDAKIFAIRNQQLRDLILYHQRLLQQTNMGAMQASLKDIFKYVLKF